MKFEFKVENGKVYTRGGSQLNKYVMDYEGACGLKMIAELCKDTGKKVFDVLKDQTLYFSQNIGNKSIVCSGFLTRTKEGLKLWSGILLDIEDGDLIFTTIAEAKAYCKHLDAVSDRKFEEKLKAYLKDLQEKQNKMAKSQYEKDLKGVTEFRDFCKELVKVSDEVIADLQKKIQEGK